MTDIQISRSQDGLSAYCMVAASRQNTYPGVAVLLELLARAGIKHGIDHLSLEAMALKKICEEHRTVAQGTPPAAGTDGRIIYTVNVLESGKPRKHADGSVDHYDLQTVINVRTGDVLARRLPPVQGISGLAVMGTAIASIPPLDVALSGGAGTAINPLNPNELIAAIDGAVSILSDKTLVVDRTRTIKSDIDYATGNIFFIGDLTIVGTVRAGFKVAAEGWIDIQGRVEDAVVQSKGDITVSGGAVGDSNGRLCSEGSVQVRHAENISIKAGKNITIIEDAMHCKLDADGTITGKSLAGGVASAGVEINLDTLGAVAGTRTVVDIGRLQALLAQIAECNNQIAVTGSEIDSINDALFAVVRDEMDGSGMLGTQPLVRLGAFKQQKQIAQKRLNELLRLSEQHKEKTAIQSNPVVKAKTIFPGAVIVLGAMEKHIDTKMHSVVVVAEENKIIVTNGQ